jgi:hypothetical protein
MEQLDRVATRVSLAALMGTLAGVGTAMYKGHPMARTVGLTAFSCAVTATACFGAERCVNTLIRKGFHQDATENNSWESVLGSHAAGGTLGGSILGTLYIGKPVHGIVFFVPFMLLVGTGEKLLYDVQEEHIQRILRTENEHKDWQW